MGQPGRVFGDRLRRWSWGNLQDGSIFSPGQVASLNNVMRLLHSFTPEQYEKMFGLLTQYQQVPFIEIVAWISVILSELATHHSTAGERLMIAPRRYPVSGSTTDGRRRYSAAAPPERLPSGGPMTVLSDNELTAQFGALILNGDRSRIGAVVADRVVLGKLVPTGARS